MKMIKVIWLISGLLAIHTVNSQEVISSKLFADLKLENLELINTGNHEFSPVIYKDGILYVSSETDDPLIDEDTGEAFWDLYYAVKDENKNLIKLGKFSDSFNTDSHEGPAGFNATQGVIYFTRDRAIYTSSETDGLWSIPNRIIFDNEDYNYCHPTLRQDDKAMIFSSNLPGGYGKMDLYISFWNGSSWSAPQNLGSNVNSEGNELFPFWHSSGLLFFSSDGFPGGFGGLDIHTSFLENGEWKPSQNLGHLINSSGDDLGFILADDGKEAFLSSNRIGGKGKDDIYKIEFAHDISKRVFVEMLDVTITILDQTTFNTIKNARVEIISTGTENENQVLLSDNDGRISAQLIKGNPYIFKIEKEEYHQKTEIVDMISERYQSIRLEPKERPCDNFASLVLSESKQVLEGVIINFTSLCLDSEINTTTDQHGYAQVCVPSNCTYDIVINMEGYEELKEKVVARSEQVDGPNRFVLKKIVEDKAIISEEDLKEGATIVLNNIYYEFNQHIIQEGAARELDQLADIMIKYPDMKIQLSAHTDSRGENEYNLNLSIKRAEAAKEYLTKLNIDAERIIPVGFGEQYIRNQCKDGVPCSEKDHQYNRRTEVRVLDVSEDIQIKYNGRN